MSILVILVFLFAQYFCKVQESKNTFTVSKIELPYFKCMPTSGYYLFYIEGEFSSEISVTDLSKTLTLNLIQPSNGQAICTPFPKTEYSNDEFQCEINICDYRIDGNILVQLDAPESSVYTFTNWEQTIGASPGTSNFVETITCLPKAKGIFNITNVESNGCNGNKNVLKLNGKWNKQISSISFELDIEGYTKKAFCSYQKGNEYITCQLEGYGDIKINEKYFTCNDLYVYLISGNDNTISVNKCSSEESSGSGESSGSEGSEGSSKSSGKFIQINSIISYLLIILLFI